MDTSAREKTSPLREGKAMKNLFAIVALTAVVALPASLPMASANAVDVDTVSVVTPVQTVTVSGSAGVNL